MFLYGCSVENEEVRGPVLYADREVDAFIELYPALALEYAEERPPEDVLDRLEIDTAGLKVIDRYVGDCLDFVVYELSPSYELVVDDNACFGFRVAIRRK
jgi:hypothetical protein